MTLHIAEACVRLISIFVVHSSHSLAEEPEADTSAVSGPSSVPSAPYLAVITALMLAAAIPDDGREVTITQLA
jgi:hypothetical protein